MTFKLFKETIEAIIAQQKHDDKCSDAFQLILNEDRVNFGYDNSILITAIFRLLKEVMQDEGEWIDYWVFDLECGKEYKKGCATEKDGKEIKIDTIENLYKYLKKCQKQKNKNT